MDDTDLRAAEQRLTLSLANPDPTAWVYDYTEDAVFDAGGDHVVRGRASLLEMARAMQPLSSVSLRPLHTERQDKVAAVWSEASWVSGGSGEVTHVRGIIVWRLEADGQWRVAMEHIG